MDLKDVVAPKWIFATKRGWGMVITFVTTMLPMLNVWMSGMGYSIDPGLVSLVGETGAQLLDTVGLVIGVALWVWGSFRPTAPITVLPPQAG